jgi:multicomponent Na+:H+ antiporter subunit E
MSRYIFALTALVFVWIILTESLSPVNILWGVGIGCLVLLFTAKFLPVKEMADVKFRKLVLFPLYLIGQIYIAGFHVIQIMLSKHEVGIVAVKTELKSETLKTILGDSVTLTPGSILLETIGDEMTLVWLRSKKTPSDPEIAGELLKGKLERRLLKAQKLPK